MSNLVRTTAQCLCTGVKVSVAEVNPKFTLCHCDQCRTWGGGPFFAVQCGTDVMFEGREKIREFDSSAWAVRGFCSDCGTHLYYRLKQTDSYNMPMGLFPQVENMVMSMQYFSDKRPASYCFSNETAEMTEAEVMAYFSAQV